MELNWIESNLFEDILDARAYQQKFIKNVLDLIKSGIDTKKLDELCKNIYRGNTPEHQEEYDENGALLLKTVNIRSNELDMNKYFYMTNTIYNDQGRFKLNEKDICITIMGATDDIVGRSWVYNKALGKACFSDGIAKIEDVKIDPYYLSTYINSKFGHLSIIQWAGSSTRSYITNNQLGKISIPIPSPEIQKYIGDKVRKAEELREEAKRLKVELEILFKRYTGLSCEQVNIEDVKSYGYILPDDIGSMIGAEVYKPDYIENQRQIKKAVKFVNLNECYKYIVNGVDCRDYLDGNGTEYYKVGSISMFGIKDQNTTHINMSLKDINDKQKINEGNLLITRKGSFGIAMAVSKKDEIGIISSEVFKLEIKNDWDTDYLAYFLNSEFGKKQFNQYSTGSTMKGINQQNIVEIIIPYISYNQQTEIGELVRAIKNKMAEPKELIQEAKQDIEDLIEGNLDTSKIKER